MLYPVVVYLPRKAKVFYQYGGGAGIVDNIVRNVCKAANRLAARYLNDEHLYSGYPNQDSLVFANVGAGRFWHKRWTNLDINESTSKRSGYDNYVHYNLMDISPLPYEDSTVTAIYTSHTIEHVTDEAVLNLFKESFRVLNQKGFLRISCPDASIPFNLEQVSNHGYWWWKSTEAVDSNSRLAEGTSPYEFILENYATPRWAKDSTCVRKFTDTEVENLMKDCKSEEDFFRSISGGLEFDNSNPGNHINWFTMKKLRTFLEDSGFQCVYQSGFGKSFCPPMQNTFLFDRTFPVMSLYVEAVKL